MNVIEINSDNYKDYQHLDIIAFSFAGEGAQGEGGGLWTTQTPANQPVFAFPISMEAPKARPSKAQALPNQDHMVIRPHGLFV